MTSQENLIINEIPKKYKSDACLENAENIPLSNFLIKKIQNIKIPPFLGNSEKRGLLIFLIINLIIKLLNKFYTTTPYTIFSSSIQIREVISCQEK